MSNRRRPNGPTPQQVALACDDFCSNATAEDVARLTAAVDFLQPGYLDQARAASAQMDRLARAVAEHADSPLFQPEHADVPAWIRLGLHETWAVYVAGEARTCRHGPLADRPQPVFAAAWRPGLVVCTRCVDLLELPPGDPGGAVCDGCGGVCGLLQSAYLALGPLMYHFGACDDCLPLTGGAA